MTSLFVGLGRMGAPMVRHYVTERDTVLFDVGPVAAELAGELGVPALASLADLPADVDVVLLIVPSSREVEQVLLDEGVLDRLPAGALVIDLSSSEPASTQRLAGLARERGIGYVDAPVSGGQAKAVTGELAIMVGGEAADVERALPHLAPMAGHTIVVGPPGAGHAAKALNNLLSATNISAVAEVLTVATRFGIDPGVMVDVVNASTGRSQASEWKYPQFVLPGTWDSGFAMDLMLKDLGIARGLFEEHGVDAPVTGEAVRVARAARAGLDGTPDHTELARHYERSNAVEFRRGPSRG